MADVIFSLKSIVIIILVSEFMKQLLVTDTYKKYINFAISLVIIGFIITALKGTSFVIEDFEDFNYHEMQVSENMVATEYKNRISEKIKSCFGESEIEKIEIEIDDKYNVTNIKLWTKLQNAGKVLEELGFNEYEIIS